MDNMPACCILERFSTGGLDAGPKNLGLHILGSQFSEALAVSFKEGTPSSPLMISIFPPSNLKVDPILHEASSSKKSNNNMAIYGRCEHF